MKAAEFWIWFQQNSNRYYHLEEQNPQELFSALALKLTTIHPDLSFEFSSIKDNGKREFVVTANGMRSAFPFVKKLVEAAPVMEDWDIIAFRQRKPGFDDVSIGQFTLSSSEIYFEYDLNQSKIDLRLFLSDYNGESIFGNAVFLLLDRLLGEYDVETKIGTIDLENIILRSDTALKLEDLPLIVDEYYKRRKQ